MDDFRGTPIYGNLQIMVAKIVFVCYEKLGVLGIYGYYVLNFIKRLSRASQLLNHLR